MDRVKKIYPHYIFSLVMLLLAKLALFAYEFLHSPSAETIKSAAAMLHKVIPEALLLQET